MADFGLTEALAIGSLAASAGGTVIGMVGAQQTAAANTASANYQAQVAENNRQIADQNKRYAGEAAQVNAQAADFKLRGILGAEAAGAGASGLDLTSGSPSEVRRSTASLGALDRANIIQAGALQSYGYGTQAQGYASQAGLYRQQAGFAQQAGATNVASTFLSGAGSLADKWLRYSNAGTFPGGPSMDTGGLV